MAVPELITVLMRAMMLLVALGINNSQRLCSRMMGHGLSLCWFLSYFDLLGPTEFISGQGSGLRKQ